MGKASLCQFDLSGFDAVGIDQLEALLRQRIDAFLITHEVINGRKRKGSYNRISSETGISSAYLHKFHIKKQAVCITNLNKIARFFAVKYVVVNFEP